jgi:hypothetical protein
VAAENIHEWAARLGLSTSALAALSGVNRMMLCLHEIGRGSLSPFAIRECMLVLQSFEVLQECLPGRLDLNDVGAIKLTLRRLWDGEFKGYKRLHAEEISARAGIAAAGEDEKSTPRVIDTAFLPAPVQPNAK